MSTTAVAASQVMDRAARLLNDPNKTDYTYTVQIPYLNMAIEELSDLMAEANTPFTNLTSTNWTYPFPIIVPVGTTSIQPPENTDPGTIKYPPDLIEIQEIGERVQQIDTIGSSEQFRPLPRKEFSEIFPRTNSLLYWVWERGTIRFNPLGANVAMEIQLKYIYQGVPYIATPDDMINVIGSRTYLAYKTAAFCAMFIGENESRAGILETQAEKAVERLVAISNKGRQQIVTRHRPFRAAYKARGGF